MKKGIYKKNIFIIIIFIISICFISSKSPYIIPENNISITQTIEYSDIESEENMIIQFNRSYNEEIVLPYITTEETILEEIIIAQQEPTVNLQKTTVKFTEKEIITFASILYSEAGGQGIDGIKAVAQVVMNRMSYYNITLIQTIFQKGIFSGTKTSSFKNRKYSQDCYNIAVSMLSGEIFNKVKNSLFFCTKTVYRPGNWHYSATGKTINKICQIGDHLFFELR